MREVERMTILGAKDACEERGAVPRPPTMKAKIEVGAAAGSRVRVMPWGLSC